MQWHFSPETGCPFWLQWAEQAGWDPRKEITARTIRPLRRVQDEWLRGGPVRRWVPRAHKDQPIYTFETGGSTGVPKSRIKMGEMEMMELFKRHVIDQALTLLKAHDNIKYLFTTPKLLEALCERISLKKAGITGVFCGGTEMTPQFHRFAVEELTEGAYFAPTYGNTLMGLGPSKPPTKDDNWA